MLLIAGLGLGGSSWRHSAPEFAKRFRVITFDHRGVGDSGPPQPYCSTDDLADDAAAVLDAAGVDRALIYGFSLGGTVAQRLALRHPDRVIALVPGATTAGGSSAVQPSTATPANLWMSGFLSPAAAAEATARSTVMSRVESLTATEPAPGYDDFTVAEIQQLLNGGDEALAKRVRDYERSHAARSGVLQATERQLKQA